MSEKFPYLARQISGPIAKYFGYGIDSVYEKDLEFIEFLSKFSIDNLSGLWLDMLGIIVGLPRPYATIPVPPEAFTFDIPLQVLDGSQHGFSSSKTFTFNGITYTAGYPEGEGGKLDNTKEDRSSVPIGDSMYRQYLKAACSAKKTHSIDGIANVVEVFTKSQKYIISFLNSSPYVQDIQIRMAGNLADYQETLQKAFNSMYTSSPRVFVTVDLSFDEEMKQEMEQIIWDITGDSEDFTISYSYESGNTIFSIVLGQSIAGYQDEIEEAMLERYGSESDIIINVTVAEN